MSSADQAVYPGDGICPSTSEFSRVLTSSYNAWRSVAAASIVDDETISLYTSSFLEMVEDIPAFRAPPLDQATVVTTDELLVECTLQWETATHPDCDERDKSTKVYQDRGEPALVSRTSPAERRRDLTCLLLAWSYILCSRWVEILQKAGEKASLYHESPDYKAVEFWDVVLECRWKAVVVRREETFCAPWSLETVDYDMSDSFEVLPDSSSAFDMLAAFCTARDLGNECIVALVMVLMLTSEIVGGELQLSRPVKPPELVANRNQYNDFYAKLHSSIDKFISLSCVKQGLDSLLCSVFFEPSVSCNLVGAQRIGISQALGLPMKNYVVTEDDYRLLEQGHERPKQDLSLSHQDLENLTAAIATRSPRLAVLWLAAIWSNDAIEVISCALNYQPLTKFLMASWTGTMQSFLQVKYRQNTTDGSYFLPRALEFCTSYYVRREVIKPFTRAPPFGTTSRSNLSLDIRQHLDHDHRPLRSSAYWVLKSGERLLFDGPRSLPQVDVSLPQPLVAALMESKIPERDQQNADYISSNATFALFYWHRNNEEGLWLADGREENLEVVRRLQSHPWISYDTDDECDGGEDEESEKDAPDTAKIEGWLSSAEVISEGVEVAE